MRRATPPDVGSPTRVSPRGVSLRMTLKLRLLPTLLLLSSANFLSTQTAPRLDDPAIEQRITKLLSQMTLEEKIGQTVHYADSSTGPGAPHPDFREQAVKGNVGS